MDKLRTMLLILSTVLVLTLGVGTSEANGLGSMETAIERWKDIEISELEHKTLDNMSMHEFLRSADFNLEKQEETEIVEHKIERGESVIAIAKKYDVSKETIINNNDIRDKNLIVEGDKLTFPSVDGYIYTIKEDDTLAKLSEKYEVCVEEVLEVNEVDSKSLQVGEKLILPGAQPRTLKTVSRSGFSSLGWPVSGSVTSSYGYRIHPVTNENRFHRGIDIGASRGTSIVAAASGEVIYSGYRNGYGNTVILKHGDNYTLYAHAQQLRVSRGQWVNKGEEIATVGSTGNATGPHLHFEVRKGRNSANNTVNPRNYLQ